MKRKRSTRQSIPNSSSTPPPDDHSPNRNWKESFNQLRKFRKRQGHCNVPSHYPDNLSLGTWVKKQRSLYKSALEGGKRDSSSSSLTLTKDQIRLLEGIGFIWEGKRGRPTKKWDKWYEELKRFKDRHGHCNVPQKYTALSEWAVKQSTEYEKMKKRTKSEITKEQIRLLRKIGFDFGYRPNDSSRNRSDSWWSRYEELKRFKKRFGHCLVKHSHGFHSLAYWVNNQRHLYKQTKAGKSSSLTEERIEALQKIEFIWNPRDHLAVPAAASITAISEKKSPERNSDSEIDSLSSTSSNGEEQLEDEEPSSLNKLPQKGNQLFTDSASEESEEVTPQYTPKKKKSKVQKGKRMTPKSKSVDEYSDDSDSHQSILSSNMQAEDEWSTSSEVDETNQYYDSSEVDSHSSTNTNQSSETLSSSPIRRRKKRRTELVFSKKHKKSRKTDNVKKRHETKRKTGSDTRGPEQADNENTPSSAETTETRPSPNSFLLGNNGIFTSHSTENTAMGLGLNFSNAMSSEEMDAALVKREIQWKEFELARLTQDNEQILLRIKELKDDISNLKKNIRL